MDTDQYCYETLYFCDFSGGGGGRGGGGPGPSVPPMDPSIKKYLEMITSSYQGLIYLPHCVCTLLRETRLSCMQTTKAQISLRICAVLLAPKKLLALESMTAKPATCKNKQNKILPSDMRAQIQKIPTGGRGGSYQVFF